jgi:hypothetical protein
MCCCEYDNETIMHKRRLEFHEWLHKSRVVEEFPGPFHLSGLELGNIRNGYIVEVGVEKMSAVLSGFQY